MGKLKEFFLSNPPTSRGRRIVFLCLLLLWLVQLVRAVPAWYDGSPSRYPGEHDINSVLLPLGSMFICGSFLLNNNTVRWTLLVLAVLTLLPALFL